MNELELIKGNPVVLSTKEGITGIVDRYIENIAFNGGDVIKDWAICEKYGLLVKSMQEGLKPYVIAQLQFCDKSETKILDTELKVVSTPTKYDYSANSEWVKQKAIVEQETAKLKDIETFIKSLKETTTTVSEETGETFTFYPAGKSSTETVRSTIK